jgi:hypothetical protein
MPDVVQNFLSSREADGRKRKIIPFDWLSTNALQRQ